MAIFLPHLTLYYMFSEPLCQIILMLRCLELTLKHTYIPIKIF